MKKLSEAINEMETKTRQIRQERYERRSRMPQNKYSGKVQTVEQELKLIETAIIMNKSQVKIYMDANRFEEMTKAAQALERAVIEYNRLYERTYR